MNILQNHATSVTTDTEQSTFPATNLELEYPSAIWKATASTQTGIITIVLPVGFNAFFIGNTNATSCTWSLSGGDSGASVVDVYDDYTSYFTGVENGYPRNIMTTFDYQTTAQTLTVTLVTTDTTIQAGVCVAGLAYAYNNPDYGSFQLSTKDASIEKGLLSGNKYYKKRNISRQFGLSFSEDQSEGNYLMQQYIDNGKISRAIDVLGSGRRQDLVFGRLEEPSGSRVMFQRNSVGIQITEEV